MSLQRGREEEEKRVEDPMWLTTMELATMVVVPMVLKTAVKMGVFEVLAKVVRPLSAREILNLLHVDITNPNAHLSLERILRFLTFRSILSCSSSSTRKYSLTPICKYLLNDASGMSLASFVLLVQDKLLMDAWDFPGDSILHGGVPFVHAHGTSQLKIGDQVPRFNKLFNYAMANHTGIFMKSLLDNYHGFDNIGSLVDVGGGIGYCISLIVTKYPYIHGINFDQLHVITASPSYLGVEHVEGDMFISIPSADAIFMKWILHDWSDDHCLRILKNCHNSLPRNGKVIVVEAILPKEVDQITTSSQVIQNLDILMLAFNEGGRARTKEEFHNLAIKAGFIGGIQECFSYNELCVIEFYKSSP